MNALTSKLLEDAQGVREVLVSRDRQVVGMSRGAMRSISITSLTIGRKTLFVGKLSENFTIKQLNLRLQLYYCGRALGSYSKALPLHVELLSFEKYTRLTARLPLSHKVLFPVRNEDSRNMTYL